MPDLGDHCRDKDARHIGRVVWPGSAGFREMFEIREMFDLLLARAT